MKNTNEYSEILIKEKNDKWNVLKDKKKEAKSVFPETYQMSIIGYIFGND